MKKTILVMGVSLGILAVMSCGNTGGTTNTAANQAKPPAKTEPAKTEPAKAALKPSDVSPDKPVKVLELLDSSSTDRMAWLDKEVAVSGFVSGTSGKIITMINDKDAKIGNIVSCVTKSELPDDLVAKTIEVKGKISKADEYQGDKSILLDPCEMKK